LRHYKNINWLYVTTPKKLNDTQMHLINLLNPIFHSSQSLFSTENKNSDMSIWLILVYQNLFAISMFKLIELYKLSILLYLPLLN
jgi:hypothetical protein